jgi:hypothetical protein
MFLIGVVGMVLFAATDALLVVLVQKFLAGAFVAPDPRIVWAIPLGAVLLFVLRGIGDYVSNFFPGWVGRQIIKSMRAELFGHYLRLPVRYYESAAIGLQSLGFRSAWAVATALGVYRDIGRIVRERGVRAWDTRAGKENDFYFVTTASFDGSTRLYKLSYNDITNPTAGATLTVALEGRSVGAQMFDNMCIDSHGRILIQEDPGTNEYLAKVWLYDIDSGKSDIVATHDPARFSTGAPLFETINEESSGIIDAKDILGDGWFLLNTQNHASRPGALVEGGQLMAMYLAPSYIPAPGAIALVGLGGLVAGRRRR